MTEATTTQAHSGNCVHSLIVVSSSWMKYAGTLKRRPSAVARRSGIQTLTTVGRRTASTTNRHKIPLMR